MNTITLVLVLATVVTGIMYAVDKLYLLRKRKAELAKHQQLSLPLTAREKKEILEPDGIWGSLVSCFPVLLVVFILRSFVYEPFRIPSASMMPTLLRGDFVLVNKFAYGLRNPFTNEVMINISAPKRGDVAVFKYPEDPRVDYIKRIVGMPGDRIVVQSDILYIQPADSKELMPIKAIKAQEQPYITLNPNFPSETGIIGDEDLLGVTHSIMRDPNARALEAFYVQNGQDYGEWVVPKDHYFAMGDNREHSRDSRFWGFVPNQYLVGRADLIWLSLSFDDGFDLRVRRLGGVD